MSELIHDAKSSWWSGDIVTLCGLRFPGGKGWKDRFFAVSINCPACKKAKKDSKR